MILFRLYHHHHLLLKLPPLLPQHPPFPLSSLPPKPSSSTSTLSASSNLLHLGWMQDLVLPPRPTKTAFLNQCYCLFAQTLENQSLSIHWLEPLPSECNASRRATPIVFKSFSLSVATRRDKRQANAPKHCNSPSHLTQLQLFVSVLVKDSQL